MKRNTSLLLAGVLILAVFLSACNQEQAVPIPNDPVEAFKLIADKQQSVTSGHVDINLTAKIKAQGDDPSMALFKDLDIKGDATGDYDSKASNVQLSGSLDLGALTGLVSNGKDKITFDLRKVGDTLYTRALDQQWNESPAGNFSLSTDNQNKTDATNPAALMSAFKEIATAERLGDEAIDGTNTYHLKISVDPTKLLGLAALSSQANSDQLKAAQDLLKDSKFELELWAGKADLLARQEKLHIVLDIKQIPNQPNASLFADMTLTLKLGKINQPVTISKP
jgi:hypothetical protein